jgi:hypothetical protein
VAAVLAFLVALLALVAQVVVVTAVQARVTAPLVRQTQVEQEAAAVLHHLPTKAVQQAAMAAQA